MDPDPLDVEQLFFRHFAIGSHLLLVLVLDFRIHLPGALFRAFFGCHANRAVCLQMAESRGDLSEVTEFERTLAEAAAGDDRDGVSGEAVDLDERHQTLAIFACRVIEFQQFHAINRQSQSEDLAGAHMAVGSFGQRYVFVERFQRHFTAPGWIAEEILPATLYYPSAVRTRRGTPRR